METINICNFRKIKLLSDANQHAKVEQLGKAILVDVRASPWDNPKAERGFLSEMVGLVTISVWRQRGEDRAVLWPRYGLECGLDHEKLGIQLFKVKFILKSFYD